MPTFEERMVHIMRYVNNAGAIAKQTSVQSAVEAWQYLREYAQIIEFGSSQTSQSGAWRPIGQLRQGPLPANPVFVAMVCESDQSFGTRLQFYWERSKNPCFYFPMDNTIVIRDAGDVESPFLCGVNALHEAGHAMRAFRESRCGAAATRTNGVIPDAYVLEEIALHTQDHLLISERVGSSYIALMSEIADTMEANKEARRYPCQFHRIGGEVVSQWLDRFHRMVGEGSSSNRIDKRWTRLIIHGHLVLCGDDEDRKLAIMRHFYETNAPNVP